MFQQRPHLAVRLFGAALICLSATSGSAQERSLTFRVSGPTQKLEMVVNSSRIVEMEFEVPRLLVENSAVLKANPLSPTQVQLAAIKSGVTHVSLWDKEGKVHSLDVIVLPDSRELEYLLKSEFPDASLRVRPLTNAVAISGYVPSAQMVSRIVAMAETYYPTVINNIEIGGAQQVHLHVKVLEVSRTKLRTMGVDWALLNSTVDVVSNPSSVINQSSIGAGGNNSVTAVGQTLAYGIVRGADAFFAYVEALRRNNLIKVLSEPTLTTVSGRAASFNVGGEFPIIVPQSLGTVSVEYRQFGTRVDFVPIVHSNGNIRLEVRPQVSEIDSSRSVTIQNTTVPGIRSRWVDTAAELRAGQTLALAGLLQNRIEAETRVVPVLGDLPWVGAAFRRVEESNNEVELLILVTPELAEPMEAHEVPQCGPGQFTGSPSDCEFYGRGYIEVPRCCPDGQGAATQMQHQPGGVYELQGQVGNPSMFTPSSGAPGPAGGQMAPVSQGASLHRPRNEQTQYREAAARPRSNPSARTVSGGPAIVNTSSGLIGPTGYDEIR